MKSYQKSNRQREGLSPLGHKVITIQASKYLELNKNSLNALFAPLK
jgi:hypothetical protein